VRKSPNKLKKALGLFELSLYGIGIILGAGIYSLIGVGAGIAGNAIWISFVFAAIIAAFTGLSYAELSSIYPKEAAEYNYTKNAFQKKNLSFIVGWLMVLASVVAAVTVAFGFAGYFTHLFGGEITLTAAFLILFLSSINYIGIKESSTFNILSTII
jgi:APA family basic amino acid/polyamine antiporter